MPSKFLAMSALALISTLSACGRSEESENNIAAEGDMNTRMAEAGPFADAEMRMSDAMKQAVGVNAGDSWVRKMIEHHKGALDMSRIALAQNVTGDTSKMAQQTIDKQTKEIAELERLVVAGSPEPASAQLYQPAEMQMHQAMMAAKGADVSEIYMRKMLAHHQGAVAMSDVALANGASGAVRTKIEKTKASQQKEATMVEGMLGGEKMVDAAPVPASARTSQVTAKAAAVTKPAAGKPVATSPKPKTSEPAADPHAGMDMNNM